MSKTSENLRKLADMFDPDEDGPTVEGQVSMGAFFHGISCSYAYSLDKYGGTNRHWCGTCACAMGWATTHPEMPVLSKHFCKDTCDVFDGGNFLISRYGADYFPDLYYPSSHGLIPLGNRDWDRAFGCGLSEDKRVVARRLRALAKELEAKELENSND